MVLWLLQLPHSKKTPLYSSRFPPATKNHSHWANRRPNIQYHCNHSKLHFTIALPPFCLSIVKALPLLLTPHLRFKTQRRGTAKISNSVHRDEAHTFMLLNLHSWKILFQSCSISPSSQYFQMNGLWHTAKFTSSHSEWKQAMVVLGTTGGGCESGFIMLSWEWSTNGTFTGFSIWYVLYFKCVLKTPQQWTHHRWC